MASFKKCPWTPREDMQLVSYIGRYGIWNWSQMPKHAGLSRSGKSCRLRWLNYLNPEIKRGNYTPEEDEIIIDMRGNLGAGWSAIAARLSGRTDNEIKNRWHTHLKKRYSNDLVKIIEPKIDEVMEQEIETPTDSDNNSSSGSAETQNFEEFYDYNLISSSMLDDNASSNNIIVPPTYGTSFDHHTSFWGQPFSSENVYEDCQATNYYPEFELPLPDQDLFQEPFIPYDNFNSNDYWFKLLTAGGFEDHQMIDSTVIY